MSRHVRGRGPLACAAAACEGCIDCQPSTVAELRSLLDKATPGPWIAAKHSAIVETAQIGSDGCAYSDYYFGPILDEVDDEDDRRVAREKFIRDGELIAALRNAAPDLLRVVEAVANIDSPTYGYSTNPAETDYACHFCDADMPGAHDPGCAWLAARKLTGRAT